MVGRRLQVKYHVKGRLRFRIVGSGGVGMFLGGTRGESEEAVTSRIDPYLEPLRTALEVEQIDKWGSSFRKTDTSDRANWDGMAKWLHDRRLIYERVLRETEV